MSQTNTKEGIFYRHRIPELSPFYKLVSDYFSEFAGEW